VSGTTLERLAGFETRASRAPQPAVWRRVCWGSRDTPLVEQAAQRPCRNQALDAGVVSGTTLERLAGFELGGRCAAPRMGESFLWLVRTWFDDGVAAVDAGAS
jgi:hypothetical protein